MISLKNGSKIILDKYFELYEYLNNKNTDKNN